MSKTTLELASEASRAAKQVVVEADHAQAQPLITELREALDFTRDFLSSLEDLDSVGSSAQQRHVDVIHALDYLDQLVELLQRDGQLMTERAPSEARSIYDSVVEALEIFAGWLADSEGGASVTESLEALSERAAAGRKSFRRHVLDEAALGQYGAADANRDIDLVRRFDELVFHLWRFVKRMNRDGME